MPPKKDDKKKKKGGDDIDYNEILRSNYRKACAAIGQPVNDKVNAVINNEEDAAAPIETLYTEGEVGPGGVRALCAALLGKGTALRGPAYKPLKALKLWRAACDDAGAAAVAELLRNAKEEMAVEWVEFMDCGVGAAGAAALGEALMLGANTTVKTLRLDLNSSLGDFGVAALCKGLRTNRSLTRLTLSYCGIGPAGAAALAEVISSALPVLEHLDLTGNTLGAEGMQILVTAARKSTVFKELVLTDNGIGAFKGLLDPPRAVFAGGAAAGEGEAAATGGEESAEGGSADASGLASPAPAAAAPEAGAAEGGGDGSAAASGAPTFESLIAAIPPLPASELTPVKTALIALGHALLDPACGLHSVALDLNPLSADEARVLLPYFTANKKIQTFKVDTLLPPDIFAVLCRAPAPSKGKKGKKGKKK